MQYAWNLERVIDSVVKDGSSSGKDLDAVENLITHILENKLELPACLLNRISDKKREQVVRAKRHPVDELLEAVKFIVKTADRDIIGSGSVSRGNRIPGLIDRADIPLIEIAETNFNNPMFDSAISLLKDYNRRMAIRLDSTKDCDGMEREIKRKTGIEHIQTSLLESMAKYNEDERAEITKAWAYEIYKSEKAVHDSILWIESTDNLKGTGEDTIEMLSSLGIALAVKRNGSVQRLTAKKEFSLPTAIRVWSNEILSEEMFAGTDSIKVAGKEVYARELKLNLGDEELIADGFYSIRQVSQAYSRKNRCSALKNSVVLLLQS